MTFLVSCFIARLTWKHALQPPLYFKSLSFCLDRFWTRDLEIIIRTLAITISYGFPVTFMVVVSNNLFNLQDIMEKTQKYLEAGWNVKSSIKLSLEKGILGLKESTVNSVAGFVRSSCTMCALSFEWTVQKSWRPTQSAQRFVALLFMRGIYGMI